MSMVGLAGKSRFEGQGVSSGLLNPMATAARHCATETSLVSILNGDTPTARSGSVGTSVPLASHPRTSVLPMKKAPPGMQTEVGLDPLQGAFAFHVPWSDPGGGEGPMGDSTTPTRALLVSMQVWALDSTRFWYEAGPSL